MRVRWPLPALLNQSTTSVSRRTEVFPRRHDDASTVPEVCAKGFSFGSIGAGLVLAAFAHGFDLAKRMSDDGRRLVHLCSFTPAWRWPASPAAGLR